MFYKHFDDFDTVLFGMNKWFAGDKSGITLAANLNEDITVCLDTFYDINLLALELFV